MRVLERNKKDLWYANRLSSSFVVDSNGLKTGEKEQVYGEPVKTRMSMAIFSGANNLGSQGIATLEPYGIVTGYTARAVTEDLNCPMEEQSRVWYGIEPTRIESRTVTQTVTETIDGEEVTHEVTTTQEVEVPVPYNYTVVRKAKSLNHLIYYLKEVDVSLRLTLHFPMQALTVRSARLRKPSKTFSTVRTILWKCLPTTVLKSPSPLTVEWRQHKCNP